MSMALTIISSLAPDSIIQLAFQPNHDTSQLTLDFGVKEIKFTRMLFFEFHFSLIEC